MLLRLSALFVFVPLAELALLVWLGRRVGLLPTVALVIVTGVLGASLARLQGLASWRRFQQALAEGRPPHRELLEGLLVLLAGAVLLTPGLLTDLTGFALLVPPLRRAVAARLAHRFAARFAVVGPDGVPRRPRPRGDVRGDGDAIDVEWEVKRGDGEGGGGDEPR